MIRRSRFLDYVDRFRAARVLVIGPAVVEVDVHCAVTRLAPDRAMPVYRVENRSMHPGAAALTASAIRNLGAEVMLLAPVGEGEAGRSLRAVLDQLGIELIEGGNGHACTPELFRYLSGGRQLLQLRRSWTPARFDRLTERLASAELSGRPIDAVCIVDATPGSIDAADIDAIAEFAKQREIPLVFDGAGGTGLVHLRGRVIPPLSHLVVNEGESKIVLSDPSADHVERLRALCKNVAPHVLLTMGRNGAVAGRMDRSDDSSECEITPITTPVHALSDRRGVGFVASGVFALCVSKAVGAETEEAAFLACSAASAAAAAPGPKSVSIDDILQLAYHEIAAQVADGVEVFERIAREHLPVIDRAARLLLEAYTNGKQVLVFGNGGSAAEANHLVTELTGQFRKKRAALPAISLSSNDALATCIANDYGFDNLFARQVEAFCRPGDVVFALSTSGRSTNVVRGLEEAKRRGAKTVGFTGEREGLMDELCDVLLAVPSRSTPRIQEAHLFVIHVMCEMLDQRVDSDGRLHPSASEI